MLNPGSVNESGAWQQSESLARSIEDALVADELIDLDEEDEEATLNRRKTFVAMSTGIINYFRAKMDVQVPIARGEFRNESEAAEELVVPLTAGTLSGRIN